MWVVGSIAGLLGLALIVAVALLEPSPPSFRVPTRLGGRGQLPTPGAFRNRRFATALGGYDPREVDAHLAELAEAYERLYLAAGPTLLARASREPETHDQTPPAAEPEGH